MGLLKKSTLTRAWLLFSLWGIHALAYANSTENTFGDVADTFQQWAQGSYGKLVLMVAVAMILGSFMFGGGAKILWGGVGLALIVKYGTTILTTIAGVSAEVTTNGSWQTTDSIGWDFIWSGVLVIVIIVMAHKFILLKKQYDKLRQKYEAETGNKAEDSVKLFGKSKSK